MASVLFRCSAVALVLQLCVCIVAGTRVVDFDRSVSSTTSNAVHDDAALNGAQHGRSLLEDGFAPAPAPSTSTSPSSSVMTPAATAKAIPTANASESVFSTAATVPAITSVATLSGYATVADFGTTEQDRFCRTLEANILRVQGVVANCSITNIVLGSVKVSNTLAFTGSDATAAEAARDSVATALASTNSADYFGTSFGTVSVSDIASTTSANPEATSGAAALGVSLVGMVGGLTFLALAVINA